MAVKRTFCENCRQWHRTLFCGVTERPGVYLSDWTVLGDDSARLVERVKAAGIPPAPDHEFDMMTNRPLGPIE